VRDPTFTDARNNLGRIYLREGRLDEAIENFNELINLNQGTADIYYNLGMALGMKGKYDEAIRYFGRGIELNPEYPEIEKRMGTALLAADKPKEAIEHLEKSLQANPNETVVYISISIAYIKTGNYKEALDNWSKAEKLQAGSVHKLNNPAWQIVTADEVSAEDANNAIEFTEGACEMTGHKEVNLLDTLAAAYAAGGRFEDAENTAQKAIEAAKAIGQNELAGEIQKRKELYLSGQRYIEK
jgi:spermidine synthase